MGINLKALKGEVDSWKAKADEANRTHLALSRMLSAHCPHEEVRKTIESRMYAAGHIFDDDIYYCTLCGAEIDEKMVQEKQLKIVDTTVKK